MLSDDYLVGFRGGLGYATRRAEPVGAYDSRDGVRDPLHDELDAVLGKLRRRFKFLG